MNKHTWELRGVEDAREGHNKRLPKEGTWQHTAYLKGWEATHDENAVKKADLISSFKQGMAMAAKDSKLKKRYLRRAEALCTRLAHRAKMRSLSAARVRPSY